MALTNTLPAFLPFVIQDGGGGDVGPRLPVVLPFVLGEDTAPPPPPPPEEPVARALVVLAPERFDASHTQQIRVTVLQQGVPVHEFDATDTSGAVAFSVTIDRGAPTQPNAVRRAATLTIVDPTFKLVPAGAGSLLAPPNEIKVEWGALRGDLHPVFVGGISEPVTDDTNTDLTVTLAMFDRFRRLSGRANRRWPRPFKPTPGMTFAEAIRAGILDRYPAAEFGEWWDSGDVIPPDLLWGVDVVNSDPAEDFAAAARSVGGDVYADQQGLFVLRRVVDANEIPTWHPADVAPYVEGETALITSLSRAFSDEPGYNGVVGRAEGDHLPEPLHSEFWDDDPLSPYRRAVWGEVPYFYVTGLATTQAQLDQSVESLYHTVRGASERLRITAVPDPRRDVSDVSLVRRARANVDGRFQHARVELPFGGGPMSIEMVERRGL